jgi:MFS family permease
MRLFRHYHARALYARIHSDFVNFELSVWLHTIARSLISVFVPILMLRFGYSLNAVLAYYVVFNWVDVPLNLLARRIVMYRGARFVILISTAFAITYFALFGQLAYGGWMILFTLAFIDAFYDSFYWVSHMYLFIESTGKPEEASRDIGILSSVRRLGSMLGPAIGAGILLFGSQRELIITSIVFYSLSMLPLFSLHHTRNKPEVRGISFRAFFRELREKRDYFTFGLYSLNSATESTLWPIFIFLAFGGLQSIAGVAIIVSLSAIAFSYVTGNLAQRHGGGRLILIGTIAGAMVWVLRLSVANGFFYYASVFLMGFFTIMIDIALDSNILERAKLKDPLMAATMRNGVSMLAQAVLFTVLFLVTAVFKVSFTMAIAALLALLLASRLLTARMKQVSLAIRPGIVK